MSYLYNVGVMCFSMLCSHSYTLLFSFTMTMTKWFRQRTFFSWLKRDGDELNIALWWRQYDETYALFTLTRRKCECWRSLCRFPPSGRTSGYRLVQSKHLSLFGHAHHHHQACAVPTTHTHTQSLFGHAHHHHQACAVTHTHTHTHTHTQQGSNVSRWQVISFSRRFYPKRLTSSAYNQDIGSILLIS